MYQLKIELAGAEPPIWRRLLVRGDMNLGLLHAVIQVAMGWTNSHLHQFTLGNVRYTPYRPRPTCPAAPRSRTRRG